ncbi:MAG: GTP-binding protein [Solobacterium sp.]|nr:GTP-binding protein [Solobacterium sp.]MDD6955071.1 GTP-binding protein [Solobacterium sp.]MDY2732303.1 GTP-binding protein [Erysipelotrichaceae bacterium]
MIKPVYFFSGMLDSGKTRAIKTTLYDERFNEPGEFNLIISMEQGDEEYDKKFLKYTNSAVEYIDYKDLTREKMQQLEDEYDPSRIIIEFNGMQNDEEFFRNGFIPEWEMAQTLTTIDGSSFRLMVANLRQFMFYHIKYAEVVIINRFSSEDLVYLRNNIKGMNQRVEIIFEDENGNVTNKINQSLFDTSKPLDISDIDYGLWYMDAVDNPDKYEGCQIELNSYYIEKVKEYENVGIFGRRAMVCCAEDVQPIAFTVIDIDPDRLEKNKYYHIKGTVKCLDDERGYKTCVVYASEIAPQEEPADPMVYFN